MPRGSVLDPFRDVLVVLLYSHPCAMASVRVARRVPEIDSGQFSCYMCFAGFPAPPPSHALRYVPPRAEEMFFWRQSSSRFSREP
jgi:hypothetical protein